MDACNCDIEYVPEGMTGILQFLYVIFYTFFIPFLFTFFIPFLFLYNISTLVRFEVCYECATMV